MDEFDHVEERLRSASDDVRHLSPGGGDRFAEVAARGQRRAVAHRVTAVAAALLVVAGVAVVAAAQDDGPRRLETTSPLTADSSLPAESIVSSIVPGVVPTPPSTEKTPPSTRSPRTTEPSRKDSSTTVPRETTTTRTPTSPQPHAAYAMHKSGEVQAEQGSYCWRGGAEPGTCADVSGDWGDDAPMVTIATSDTVAFRWATSDQPKGVEAYVFTRSNGETDYRSRRDVSCMGGNPCRMALKLAPGEYLLSVFSTWPQGDVTHGIRLTVQ